MALSKSNVIKLALAVGFVAALALVWKVTPLSEYATPEKIVPLLETVRATPWAVPAGIALYTIGTLLFFPHMAMTATIVIVFAPLQAFTVAMTGSIISGSIGFFLGKKLGMKSMHSLIGDTAEKISGYAKKGGILGITLLRMLPIAPYTAVNLALGMLEVTYTAFIVGTFLGTLPGTAIASFLGFSFLEVWQDPNRKNLTYLGIGLILWVSIIAASHLAGKMWRKRKGVPAA